jgi:hypothetical protein
VVEYAILVAKMSGATIGSLTSTAEVWLSRVNWELVAYFALALIALRLVTWAFRTR